MAKISKSIVLLLVVLLFSSGLHAQRTINIKGAKGTGELVGRISYEEARREALNKAKVEALRKAGVSEHLQSYESLFRSEGDNDFSEFFSSDIQSELQGAVKDYEIVNHERKVDPQTNLFTVEVTIDATVVLYDTKPDPTFNVRVEGIKGVYEAGEILTFSVFATQKCYLHIFNISDTYTTQMYPNAWESFIEIPSNKKITFPFEQIIEYELFKESDKPELNRLVLVFTKKPIHFLNHSGGEEQKTSSEAIFSWIYGLTPDVRKVDYQVFTLR